MKPKDILDGVYELAAAANGTSVISDASIRGKVDYVCRCTSNRAGIRLLMSCLLGKLHRPEVDPRKPYTEIGGKDCFSGRTYDEQHLMKFIAEHQLPVNHTTAFLTPTLRNIDFPLTIDRELVGRPRELYKATLELLDAVAHGGAEAKLLLVESIRVLLLLREEKRERMDSLLGSIKNGEGSLPLSSEAIVTLISQHLDCRHASRLPVLVVAAAYSAAGHLLKERLKNLNSHNAADLQTGSVGDVEVCLEGDDCVVTAFEMKMKKVTRDDVDVAVAKLVLAPVRIHNYLFITTDAIDPDVLDYAKSFYEKTVVTEISILDCKAFLRYFLHLFHRVRVQYLDKYQELVLAEPDSAVSQALKEAFLALRLSAESDG